MMRSYALFVVGLLCFVSVPAFCQDSKAGDLSPKQIAAIKAVEAETAKRAAPVALELAAAAKQVFDNMLSDHEDQKLRRRLSIKMHKAAGELLDIKGRSFREMLAILTPEQKRMVREAVAKPGSPADLSEVIKNLFHLAP